MNPSNQSHSHVRTPLIGRAPLGNDMPSTIIDAIAVIGDQQEALKDAVHAVRNRFAAALVNLPPEPVPSMAAQSTSGTVPPQAPTSRMLEDLHSAIARNRDLIWSLQRLVAEGAELQS